MNGPVLAALVMLAAQVVMLAAPASADTVANLVERARLDIQPAGAPFKQITIDNPLGNVRVEGWDGTSIQIETRKQAPDEEGLDRLRISLIPNPDGSVRITTTADGGRELKPLARGSVHIDLVVRAPREARIEAAASAGTLEVINMDAGGDLDTASGKISVRNVSGGLSTHSVSGATSITQAFGSVDAQTLSSDLDLDSIGGERLVASASHGKIAGRRVRSREIELTTNDGRIMLEAEASLRGRLVIASMKGDVDVRLHRHNTAIIVRARGTKVNLGGPLQTMPDGWVETRFGQPASGILPALVELRSRYGLVNFVIVN
jgi:hypothetical protein